MGPVNRSRTWTRGSSINRRDRSTVRQRIAAALGDRNQQIVTAKTEFFCLARAERGVIFKRLDRSYQGVVTAGHDTGHLFLPVRETCAV